MSKTLMVMAGGTGGHVYPAMAVADYLKAKDWKIVWLVTEGGMENRLIDGKGYDTYTIQMRGVRGKGIKGWLMLPIKLAVAFSQCFKAIRKYQPNVVLGMGGFAAFPGGVMAWLLRKPLVVHEQNSVAGLTNKILAHFSTRLLAAFPSAFGNKATVVGNPVRKEIALVEAPLQRMQGRSGPFHLLVVGGSLGAQALNEMVPKAVAMLPEDQRPEIIHQAGVEHILPLTENYKLANVKADTRGFIEDMAATYAWADLVICRSGALTIAELSAVGVASVLVPFPHAVDDHQTGNAAYLANNGAAMLIQQKDMTVADLHHILSKVTREKLLKAAQKARALGKPGATQVVAEICMEVAK